VANTPISARQAKFLTALMTAGTQSAAAKTVGATAATATGWLKQPAMQAEYLRLRREMLQHGIALAQKGTIVAVQRFLDLLEDHELYAAFQIQAARAILDFAMKGTQLEYLEEIARRLAVVEARLEQEEPG